MHTKLVALAKTVSKYPRKHRDLSGTLDDAVEALEEFKDIEWPPNTIVQAVLDQLPSWMEDEEDGNVKNSMVGEKETTEGEGREEEEMSELASKMKRQVNVSESSLSNMSSSSGGEEKKHAAAEATLGEDLDDDNVNDEEEAEQLHQAVLHAGEVDNTTKEEEGTASRNDENGEKEVQPTTVVDNNQEEDGVVQQHQKEGARLETIEQQGKPLQTPHTPPPPTRRKACRGRSHFRRRFGR